MPNRWHFPVHPYPYAQWISFGGVYLTYQHGMKSNPFPSLYVANTILEKKLMYLKENQEKVSIFERII